MLFDTLLNLLFPHRCCGCACVVKGTVPLCAACAETIELNRSLFCGTCRARLPEAKKICHKDTPYLLGAATSYTNPAVRGLIHDLKFTSIENAALPLARILIAYAKQLPLTIEKYVVIPLPLSKARARERGFNQSQKIAQHFTKNFNVPLMENILVRTAHTLPQSHTKNRAERRTNVAGAFMAKESLATHPRIILIDDVTTSGATFSEAASALRQAGAKEIIALAVAMA